MEHMILPICKTFQLAFTLSTKRYAFLASKRSIFVINASTLRNKSSRTPYASGYESETAEISDALKQFNLSDHMQFNEDDDNQLANASKELSNEKPLRSEKGKSQHKRTNEFHDYRRVRVKGGKGGDGMICFLKLWSNPMAGPSGGDGGHGGHVVFEACKNVRSLNHIKSSYSALSGENGQSKDMTGANAEHLFIQVPLGTLVKEAYSGKLVADLNQPGMKFLAAKGGSGGKGNHYFLNNTNRHPRVAEIGASGEENNWILELKILAHAGLVGFPNAGKSTLLSAISRAKPKVASYPFTTLKPMVGIVEYEDEQQLAVADLPGLIEGAHQNRGLGIGFLRHVQRCVCLIYVIDLVSSVDPYNQLQVLMNELDNYHAGLSKRPVAIVANKMDLEHAQSRLEQFRQRLQQEGIDHLPLIPVSGKFGHNITQLLVHLRKIYDMNHLEQFNKDID